MRFLLFDVRYRDSYIRTLWLLCLLESNLEVSSTKSTEKDPPSLSSEFWLGFLFHVF